MEVQMRNLKSNNQFNNALKLTTLSRCLGSGVEMGEGRVRGESLCDRLSPNHPTPTNPDSLQDLRKTKWGSWFSTRVLFFPFLPFP